MTQHTEFTLVFASLAAQFESLDADAHTTNTTDPDRAEQSIGEDTTKNIDFTVNASTIDLVEQRHQNERVKYHREVFGRSVTIRTRLSIMHIKQTRS